MSEFTNATGYIEVGDGHQLYWEDWGNPEGVPILSLHGGPGSGFSDKHKVIFDPDRHHVIFHDQRGSGNSTPFASTDSNTTQLLVEDIDRIRNERGLDKATLVGGSWGSTLALCYSIEFPHNVDELILWGVYTGSQFENDWVNEGYPRFNFPAEWERFIALVPDEHRSDGDSIMAYYADKIHSESDEVALQYAVEWTLWESTLMSIEYDPDTLVEEVSSDPNTLAIARLETHYFRNKCFLPQDYIKNNLSRIAHIPIHAVQGRFDFCVPPATAYELAKEHGQNMTLEWVNAGHLRTDRYMLSALKRIISERTPT